MADLPPGYKDIPEEDRKRAKVFFDRAKVVADTGNNEYAIEMYIQGLTFDPESLDAHQAIREVSLRRKATGGKPMGMSEKWKLPKPAKDDFKQAMLNAEKLLAYDPGNMDHMVDMLVAAQKSGFYDTCNWIGPILFRANLDLPEKKQDFKKFITLKEVYKAIQEFGLAIEALHAAMRLKPNDMDLSHEVKDLSASHTVRQGNYDTGGSFTQSIRNRKAQEELMRNDTDVRTMDVLAQAIHNAEQAYAAEPNDPGKFTRLIDTLRKTEQTEYENRAIELLDQKYQDTKQYKYRLTIGQIQIAQLARMERPLRDAANKNPKDPETVRSFQQFRRDRAEQELEIYRGIVENYPTETTARFEMASRLFLLGRFDEAIPVFQQARTDPKNRVAASVLLGRAFLEAQYVDEAVDTLLAIITDYPVKGDEKSIDMHYWYARALETKGDPPAALKMYSQVAQWNFNYRDVQARIKRLRGLSQPQGQASAPGAV